MSPIALVIPYFKENRPKIIAGVFSLIVVDLLQLIIPRFIKRAVDDLTTQGAAAESLALYAWAIIGLAVLIGGFRYVWRLCLLGTSRRVEEGLRDRLFAHLQNLSAAYFDRTRTGDLMAHATNDIQQIRMATGMGLVALNDAVVMGAAAIGFMVYINLTLTLLVLIPMPLIVLGTRFFSRKMHHRYQAVQASFADLTESVRERMAGIRLIKAHNRKTAEAARVAAASRAYVARKPEAGEDHGGVLPDDDAVHQPQPGHRALFRRPPDHPDDHHPGRLRRLHQLPGSLDLADDGARLGHQPDPARAGVARAGPDDPGHPSGDRQRPGRPQTGRSKGRGPLRGRPLRLPGRGDRGGSGGVGRKSI